MTTRRALSTKGAKSAQKALRWRGPARRKEQGNAENWWYLIVDDECRRIIVCFLGLEVLPAIIVKIGGI